MFYSQFLLSKKAPLGVVWMAGHCLKRLRKDQVQQTDIANSVDISVFNLLLFIPVVWRRMLERLALSKKPRYNKILGDEVREVTHRILAFLLLGVVRIYSRKVEYLFHASQELLNKLFSFESGKDKHACTGVLRSPRPRICLPKRFKLHPSVRLPKRFELHPSISLPNRFELDAFEVEDFEDGDLDRGNKRSRLADGVQRQGSATNLLINQEKMTMSEPELPACTPPKDVLSTSRNDNISLVGLDKLREASFSIEHHLDPTMTSNEYGQQVNDELIKKHPETTSKGLNDAVESDSHPNLLHSISQTVPDVQMLFGDSFSLDDRLEPMVLNEVENAQLGIRSSNGNKMSHFLGSIWDVEIDPVRCTIEDSESGAGPATLKENVFSLRNPPSFYALSEAVKRQGCGREGLLDSSVDQAQLERAKKTNLVDPECDKSPRQEEFQVPTRTPNSNLQAPGALHLGTSTLVTPYSKEQAIIRQKRKVVWDSTLVLSNSIIKNWLDDTSKIKRQRKKLGCTVLAEWKSLKLGRALKSIFEPFIPGFVKDLDSLEVKKSMLMEDSSAGDDGAGSPVDYAVDDPISVISSPERSPVVCRTHETSPNGVNSTENVSDAFPSRTRMTESFLGRKFKEKKKEKGGEVLNYTELVAGKTKGDSARMFYDILVLKSRDLIDVYQEEAYGDIRLQKASKSKNGVGNSSKK